MSVIDYCKYEDTFGENATVHSTDDKNRSILKFFISLKSNIKAKLKQIVHSQEM